MSRLSSKSGLTPDPDLLAETLIRKVTAAAITLTVEDHNDRLFVLDSVYSTTVTITLPAATGTGAKYTIFNNAVQTSAVNIVLAVATDYMTGVAVMLEQAGGTDDVVFYTTATSDKIVLNASTTGGIRGDKIEAIDYRAGYYLVNATIFPSGDVVTPFSAT